MAEVISLKLVWEAVFSIFNSLFFSSFLFFPRIFFWFVEMGPSWT